MLNTRITGTQTGSSEPALGNPTLLAANLAINLSLNRIQTLIPTDIVSGFLREESPRVLKYSIMSLKPGKLMMRFCQFRTPHREIVAKAWEEIKRVDTALELGEVIEPGTTSRIGDLLSINDYTGTGLAAKLLREALPRQIFIMPR